LFSWYVGSNGLVINILQILTASEQKKIHLYTENKHLLIQQMYALIFNPQKVLLDKPKDLLISQMLCQFPNLVSQNHLEIDRTFVTPKNLLVYLTKLFVG
jgi:hypothetical protein